MTLLRTGLLTTPLFLAAIILDIAFWQWRHPLLPLTPLLLARMLIILTTITILILIALPPSRRTSTRFVIFLSLGLFSPALHWSLSAPGLALSLPTSIAISLFIFSRQPITPLNSILLGLLLAIFIYFLPGSSALIIAPLAYILWRGQKWSWADKAAASLMVLFPSLMVLFSFLLIRRLGLAPLPSPAFENFSLWPSLPLLSAFTYGAILAWLLTRPHPAPKPLSKPSPNA